MQGSATDIHESRALLEKLDELADLLRESGEIMNSRSAAAFLDMTPSAFGKIAPDLPRFRISDNRYLYSRKDLLEWLEVKRDNPQWWYRRNG